MAILDDFDVWYKPCEKCGFDPAKGKSNKCWKCGNRLHRDYSDRALKQNRKIWTKNEN